MNYFETFVNFLGSTLTPFTLLTAAFLLLTKIPLRKVFSPREFFRTMRTDKSQDQHPFAALSMALAGTLGVGNITGVASALISGGPGAVFWMWVGAVVSMVVKYAEVYLAVEYRRKEKNGYIGGAMYYLRDGLTRSGKVPYKVAATLGGGFAGLCLVNSLVTGNIVQANAAACVVPEQGRLWCGVVLAGLVILSLLYGAKKIERITAKLMPPLTGVYMAVAVGILLRNANLVPEVLSEIVGSAFGGRALLGGTVGFTVREGVRFGVMRGIFSNEAGCGTSPTAHASADTDDPHRQACLGVVEVVFDTLILCTMTAVVLLVAERRYGVLPWRTDADTAAVTLEAFGLLGGEGIRWVLTVAVVLFAYATILAQLYYGTVAMGYLTRRRWAIAGYYAVSAVCTVVGSVIAPPVMWTIADAVIGGMTVINCVGVVVLMRKIR